MSLPPKVQPPKPKETTDFKKARSEILELISTTKEEGLKVAILVHVSPDIDSVCTSIALRRICKKLGVEADIFGLEAMPDLGFSGLFGLDEIAMQDPRETDWTNYGMAFMNDVPGIHRFVGENPSVIDQPFKPPKDLKIVTIDHHQGNTQFGHVNIWMDTGSAAELVSALFGNEVDQEIARILLRAIIADSGQFAHDYTSPHTLRQTANLMEKGANLYDCIQDENSLSTKQFKILMEILGKIEFLNPGYWRIVFRKGEREKYKEADFDKAYDAFRNRTAKFLSDVQLGAIVTDKGNGEVRMVFWSSGSINARDLAVEFGGGGHRGAAGAAVKDMNLEETLTKIHSEVLKLLK